MYIIFFTIQDVIKMVSVTSRASSILLGEKRVKGGPISESHIHTHTHIHTHIILYILFNYRHVKCKY